MGFADSFTRAYAGHRFTALFSVLLLSIAGHGLVGTLLPRANPLQWLLGLCLVAIVFSAPRGRLRWFLGGVTLICVSARLVQGWVDHPAPPLITQSLVLLACALGSGVAVHRAFLPGRVDAEHLCAALSAYLLAGIAFGCSYWLMEAWLPGSFSSVETQGFAPPRAIYFSFVVQATLGFGDIVPLNQPAQGVVVAQGVAGQMYLAVLVARLVGLHTASPRP